MSIIQQADGHDIRFDLNVAEHPKGIVLFIHGYKGFKDWGPWHLVSDAFAKAGLSFLKFNFSHNGTTATQPTEFADPEAFGRNTYSRELQETKAVIDYAAVQYPGLPIYLVGHSRGGGISILTASDDVRVAAVASWAAVSSFHSRVPLGRELEQFKEDGVVHVTNSRTGQQLPHYWSFYQDTVENHERLDIARAARSMNKPWLLVHGTGDEAVSVIEAENLAVYQPAARLTLVSDTGHTFGGSHPWEHETLPADLEMVVNATVDFFLTEAKA